MGLMRARAAFSGVLGVLLALAAGRVFDAWIGVLVVPSAMVAVVGVATLSMRWYVRLVAVLVALVAGIAVVIVAEGGSIPGDLVDAVVSGARRVLSTEWPSPRRPDVVGAVAAIAGLGTALAVTACGWRRWHLLALAPPVTVFVLVVAASAPAGPATWWLVPLGLVAICVAALVPTGELGETVRILVGERRAALMAAVAAGLALAVSLPLQMDDRADPRREQVASAVEPVVDPIESVVALRTATPARELYRLGVDRGATVPPRWRTAVLEGYDGQRWAPTATLSPIGERLGPDRPDQIDVTVDLLERTDVVPLPGPPVAVDAAVETDGDRTVVRLVEPAEPGTLVHVVAGVEPLPGAVTGQLATRPVDEISARFTSLATSLGGTDGTIAEQLERIRAALHDGFALEPDASAGGLQLALMDRFLTETRRGTEEQFVTGFVLLARALGVDARVAIGYEPARAAGSESSATPTVTLASDAAAVWPEVRLAEGGWVTLDPVPDSVATPDDTSAPNGREVAPAAPQPPVVPPVDNRARPDDTVPPTTETDSGWPVALVWATAAGLAVAAVVVPLLLVVVVIILVKRARRRRRLRAPEPAARVRGAWAEATDLLVDAGLRIAPSWTDDDIADAGAAVAEDAHPELVRLGALSSAATFSTGQASPAAAETAVVTLEQVESTLARSRSRWQRLRWRLSLRSLRRSTRSPVLGTGQPGRRRRRPR